MHLLTASPFPFSHAHAALPADALPAPRLDNTPAGRREVEAILDALALPHSVGPPTSSNRNVHLDSHMADSPNEHRDNSDAPGDVQHALDLARLQVCRGRSKFHKRGLCRPLRAYSPLRRAVVLPSGPRLSRHRYAGTLAWRVRVHGPIQPFLVVCSPFVLSSGSSGIAPASTDHDVSRKLPRVLYVCLADV